MTHDRVRNHFSMQEEVKSVRTMTWSGDTICELTTLKFDLTLTLSGAGFSIYSSHISGLPGSLQGHQFSEVSSQHALLGFCVRSVVRFASTPSKILLQKKACCPKSCSRVYPEEERIGSTVISA